MKNFRTEFRINPCQLKVSHPNNVLTIGSCFSETIGNRLEQFKFQASVNPFGVVYNPISIFDNLLMTLSDQAFDPDLCIQHHAKFVHFHCHSRLNAFSKEELMSLLSQKQRETFRHLQTASHLFITFGSAFAYRHRKSGRLVANCHKIPQREFKKELLELEQMSGSFEIFNKSLKRVNPYIQIVLTLSPVRHIKDGIPENQLSKSMLRVLCDQLTHSHSNIGYFPAYELMMDDLRDYRFYKDDLIHPNAMAEDYIWEKFQDSFFDVDTRKLTKEIDQVHKSLSHRPFEPLSPQHGKFLKALLDKVDSLPGSLDFAAEKNAIMDQLRQIEAYYNASSTLENENQ
ncbi:GSCFA domain-containing protein [Cyclobacterium jeungdonense]|uniref:GSCFA domain-containing protein n=1 Tax=Cyclobacterium jeungdonense TaxID=708087 RepID=A0ABT8CB39_9BACT|nr:GSCFA domain-containing protein [Cyclobacterium jeungdonense]MDN3690010.1 GSCFA domain-containing protein [Cyclobacterium jeungdonense]